MMNGRIRKIRAYTALRRTTKDGTWYLSELIYQNQERFRELYRNCAARCREEGDGAGEALWSDDENMKLIPVEVEIPDGVKMMNIDCAASVEGGAK